MVKCVSCAVYYTMHGTLAQVKGTCLKYLVLQSVTVMLL